MGSILVNYYRKKDPKDNFVPAVRPLRPFPLPLTKVARYWGTLFIGYYG